MATKYQAGAAVERRIKKKYEDAGYYVVRSAGSKGLFDLIAFGRTHIDLIQVKAYTKDEDKPNIEKLSEIDKIRKLPVPRNCFKVILLYQRRKRKNNIEKHIILGGY